MKITISNKNGFTLIEMLVVLVILGLTTTLLSDGLSNTWRNFERLSGRDLVATSAQLPVNWFLQSVDGAVLYHPYKPVVKGSRTSFEFISTDVPNDKKNIPQTIRWWLEFSNGGWELKFNSELNNEAVTIQVFKTEAQFEYLENGTWVTDFNPTDSRLPMAIRLVNNNKMVFMAKPGRPVLADVPPELPLFGEYEF